MATREAFLTACARLPSGVVIITACDREGVPTGATIGSFSSLSMEPPMAYFAMFNTSRTLAAIRETGRFAVHLVDAPNCELAPNFASRSPAKFGSDLDWTASPDGVPLLAGFSTRLICGVTALAAAGDHEIVTCSVDKVELNDATCEPAVWFMRDFRNLQLPGLASATSGAEAAAAQ